MSSYRNFSVDFPKRVDQLHIAFRPFAVGADLSVTYTLMRLAAGFLLPYERTVGKGGAGRAEVSSKQAIRSTLKLDQWFLESAYVKDRDNWSMVDTDKFDNGPRSWNEHVRDIADLKVHDVLEIVRHATAHSNLFFGGSETIEHIYLGNRQDRDEKTNKYRVLRCSPDALENLVDQWHCNVERLRSSPALIWAEIEKAAPKAA